MEVFEDWDKIHHASRVWTVTNGGEGSKEAKHGFTNVLLFLNDKVEEETSLIAGYYAEEAFQSTANSGVHAKENLKTNTLVHLENVIFSSS